MSIYASFGIFDDDEEDHPAPIIYRESHVMPTRDDKRGGELSLACIPGFVTLDGRDVDGRTYPAEPEHEGVWPFLRVSVRPHGHPDNVEDTVVLDRDQVELFRDELSDWLLRCDDWHAWMEKHQPETT